MKSKVQKLTVHITRVVDDSFPGFVECSFEDVEGRLHQFVEKLCVVSDSQEMPSKEDLPLVIQIDCLAEEKVTNDREEETVQVDIAHPWSIVSTTGKTRFIVAKSAVSWK